MANEINGGKKGRKALERDVGEALGSGADLSIAGFPAFKIACHCRRRFVHHSLLRVVWGTLCRGCDVPILVTRTAGARGAVVSLPLDDFADLLEEVRVLRAKTAGVAP